MHTRRSLDLATFILDSDFSVRLLAALTSLTSLKVRRSPLRQCKHACKRMKKCMRPCQLRSPGAVLCMDGPVNALRLASHA